MGFKDFFISTLKACTRQKSLGNSADTNTDLKRCLSILDLTFIGVGSTLGAGIYVLAGEVAKNKAGPAIVISFLIAAIASFLSGLCYSEFGARFPKAGSAYVYCYVAVGEFSAFFIGWNMVMEYLIGASAIVSGLTNYLDALTNGYMKNSTIALVGRIHVETFNSYLNIYAILFTIILTIILALGMKGSAAFNNILVGLNIITILIVISVGLFHSNFENWRNFFPFGVQGVMRGASTCFFAFIGFDVIATTGEEAKNPGKSIPISILLTIFICFIAYFGVSSVVTLMVPYSALDSNAAVATVFRQKKLIYMVYIVGVGATVGLLGCCLVSLMPAPRLLYAISQDGLLPKIFSKVNDKTNVPIIGTIITGIFVALMAALLNLNDLVEMLSIGTLMAYSVVDICVMLLRYRHQSAVICDTDSALHCQRTGLNKLWRPDTLKNILIFVVVSGLICLCIVVNKLGHKLIEKDAFTVTTFFFLSMFLVISSIMLSRLPANVENLSFAVPMVPWLPMVALFFNISLMLELSHLTWLRFVVWMAIGIIIYFSFGIYHSIEGRISETSRESGETALLLEDVDRRQRSSPSELPDLMKTRNKLD